MFGFFLSKAVKDKFFILLLTAVLLVPSLALFCGETAALPCGGFALSETPDADAQRLSDYLRSSGLLEFESREALAEAVDASEIDAGLYIPGNLSECLKKGETDGIIELICTSRSLFPQLWKSHCGAALFSVLAPYIETEAFGGAADYERVSEIYYSMLSDGQLVEFDLKTVGGTAAWNIRGRNSFLLFAGIILFAAAFLGIARCSAADYRIAAMRLQRNQACLALLAELAARLVTVIVAACGGCLLAGFPELILRVVLFVIICTIIAVPLTLALSDTLLTVYCSFMLLLALAVCPVFADLALFFTPLRFIRMLVPVYWLFV